MLRCTALGLAAAACAAALCAVSGAATTVPPVVVAFTATRDAAGHAPLVVARADGSDARIVTDGKALDAQGAWSPDGRRIAFLRVDDSRVYSSLGIVDLDSGAVRDVSASPYDETPAWSPDGTWLAFQAQTDYGSMGGRADTTFDLYAIRPDGSGLRQLGSGGTTGSSEDFIGWGLAWDWSPDSQRIAFMQPDPKRLQDSDDFGWRLVVSAVDSGEVVARLPLTTDYTVPDPYLGWSWSPTGRRLAYVRPTKLYGQSANKLLELVVIDFDSRKARAVAAPLSRRQVPWYGGTFSLLENLGGWEWSPDGRRIAAVLPDGKRREPKTHRPLLHLAVVDAATGASWQIPGTLSADAPEGSSLALADTGWAWSPDGRYISVVRRAGTGRAEVLVADVVRRTSRVAGSGTAAAWSPDGSFLAVSRARWGGSCGGVWIVTARTGVRKRIVSPPGQTACDRDVEWAPDGSYLAFTRVRGSVGVTFTVSPNGSNLHQPDPASSANVSWPADCDELFLYRDSWIVPDALGVPQLVARPAFPEDAWASWRC